MRVFSDEYWDHAIVSCLEVETKVYGPSDEMIAIAETKTARETLRKNLEPLDLWDESQCGIWVVVEYH